MTKLFLLGVAVGLVLGVVLGHFLPQAYEEGSRALKSARAAIVRNGERDYESRLCREHPFLPECAPDGR